MSENQIKQLINLSIQEDKVHQDITSKLTIPNNLIVSVNIVFPVYSPKSAEDVARTGPGGPLRQAHPAGPQPPSLREAAEARPHPSHHADGGYHSDLYYMFFI